MTFWNTNISSILCLSKRRPTCNKLEALQVPVKCSQAITIDVLTCECIKAATVNFHEIIHALALTSMAKTLTSIKLANF